MLLVELWGLETSEPPPLPHLCYSLFGLYTCVPVAPTHAGTRVSAGRGPVGSESVKREMPDEQVKTLFKDAASREERVASVAGGPVVKRSELTCVNCGRAIGGNVAFAPTSGNHDASAADETQLFCDTCHPVRLGPTCRGCGKPAPRDEAVVALDCHWHRACLRCEEPGCNKQLPDEYYEWKGELRCREHYVQVGADRCAKCGEPVDGGLRALGQVWHDECLTCKVTGETLGEGEFYVHQGGPLSGSALRQTAALCKACGEPALQGRVFAMGNVFHHACFRCACCHSEIGERRFVPYDGEPYLEGCYQKLFGALSGQMQELVQGDTQRCARPPSPRAPGWQGSRSA